ncbi:unnamed protein product [Penicillium salamii]|nr:unnamed protein product [Penicillium salamii]CAG8130855.1 unnamed protein product [Penicillium salamii]CAG8363209.1 unnamed protein product [Penicillium salamii]
MPSECVDGTRKPPKYLCEPSIKRKRIRKRNSQVTPIVNVGHSTYSGVDTTNHAAFLSGKNVSHAENFQPHKTDSLADIFDQTIDPAYFDTTWISNFTEQNSTGSFAEEKGHFASFCRGSQHWTFSEELSSESENGGAGTSDQPLEGILECKSPEHLSSPAHNIYFGFTIGSGWSGTFFPDGDDEKPWNVHG